MCTKCFPGSLSSVTFIQKSITQIYGCQKFLLVEIGHMCEQGLTTRRASPLSQYALTVYTFYSYTFCRNRKQILRVCDSLRISQSLMRLGQNALYKYLNRFLGISRFNTLPSHGEICITHTQRRILFNSLCSFVEGGISSPLVAVQILYKVLFPRGQHQTSKAFEQHDQVATLRCVSCFIQLTQGQRSFLKSEER